MTLPRAIFIGFDPRQTAAFAVARHSIAKRFCGPVPIYGIVLDRLIESGLYRRPTSKTITSDGPLLIDHLSTSPDHSGAMSTEFAVSRFFLAELMRRMTRPGHLKGWGLFLDCDMLVRADLSPLFNYSAENQRYAVRCVKHPEYRPANKIKMDGQIQSPYVRKNWSSFMLLNMDHPSNQDLTLDLLNSAPGRDLHRLCWLKDEEIGELGPEWNYLVGETRAEVDPKVVHFTNGGPWLPRYETVPFADEWRNELCVFARPPQPELIAA